MCLNCLVTLSPAVPTVVATTTTPTQSSVAVTALYQWISMCQVSLPCPPPHMLSRLQSRLTRGPPCLLCPGGQRDRCAMHCPLPQPLQEHRVCWLLVCLGGASALLRAGPLRVSGHCPSRAVCQQTARQQGQLKREDRAWGCSPGASLPLVQPLCMSV